MKHNKKRNTAFLYETVIKELTKSIVKKNNEKKYKLKRFFEICFELVELMFSRFLAVFRGPAGGNSSRRV